jgi:tetratricopeptide (TPR) repeat protein
VYHRYGHALLSLAEATASVFGGAVQTPEEGTDADQDAKEMADDMETAWEMLEVARVIYSRYPEELAIETQLARVYMRLGDVGMELDNFEQARNDFEKAVMLRKKVLKATNDPDTTLLADLYCNLAISCIYRGSGKPAEDASTDGTAPDKQDEEAGDAQSAEEDGLKYYVLAGRVMAQNVHRVALACAERLQQFAKERIPVYGDSDDDSAAPKGKGKRKAAAADGADDARSLLFLGNNMDKVKEEFVACATSESVKAADVTPDGLTESEATLLDYMEIYVEIKEKADGIKESAAAEPVAAPADGEPKKEEPETTIGFGAASSSSSAATTVNVIPVVKKRKTEAPAEKEEAAGDAKE